MIATIAPSKIEIRIGYRHDVRRALKPAPINPDLYTPEMRQASNASRPRRFAADAAKRRRYSDSRAARYGRFVIALGSLH